MNKVFSITKDFQFWKCFVSFAHIGNWILTEKNSKELYEKIWTWAWFWCTFKIQRDTYVQWRQKGNTKETLIFKKARRVILIGKVDFKAKKLTSDRQGYYVMIKSVYPSGQYNPKSSHTKQEQLKICQAKKTDDRTGEKRTDSQL